MYAVLLALVLAGTPDVQTGCIGQKVQNNCAGSKAVATSCVGSCTGKVRYTRVRLAVSNCTGTKEAASCTGSKVAASCTGSKAPRVKYIRAKLVSSCTGAPAKNTEPMKGTTPPPPPPPPVDSKPTKKVDYLPPIQSEILIVSPRSYRYLTGQ